MIEDAFCEIPAEFVHLPGCLRHRASSDGHAVAVGFLNYGATAEAAKCDSLTYGELEARASSLAAQLRLRCKTGDRALLVFPPGLDFIAAFFGCLYAGV